MTPLESCYLLKYVGRKKKPDASPWAIRHALIYQKINKESNQSSHILIRLPNQVMQQLSSSIGEEGSETVFATDWTRLHAACFSMVDADLRNMVNYLDAEVVKVVRLPSASFPIRLWLKY